MKLIEKYRAIQVEVKASFWYMLCNILQKGIALIVVPIYTRMLTKGEYGVYTLFQSWKDLLIIFVTLNLYAGVFTRGLVRYDKDRDRYTSAMQGLSTAITLVFFLVYLVFQEGFRELVELNGKVCLLLFVFYIFFPSIQFWSVRQRVENKYKKLVVVTLLISVLTPAVSIGLLLFSDLREQALIYGYFIVQILAGAILYIQHFLKCHTFFHREYWVEGLKFNIPLIPHYLSLTVLSMSDRIMIGKMCDSAAAGEYSLVYNISQILIIINGAINGALVPWLYEKLKKEEYGIISRVSNILCMGLVIMSAGIIAIAPEAVYIMGGKEYMGAIWCIPPIAIGTYITFCYGLFSSVEFHYGKTGYVSIASGVGAVVNLITNYIFIPIFGYVAAAYTTGFCYLLLALMHYVFMKRTFSGTVFDIKGILRISALLVVLAAVYALSYHVNILRYLLIVCLLAICFIKREYFMGALKQIK